MSIVSGALTAIKNRLFFLSSVVGAGAVASYAASPEQGAVTALAVILQTLAGLAANYGASEVYDVVSKRITHEDVLRNNDLTNAVRDAVSVILLDEADETQIEEDRDALRTMADTDAKTWELAEVLQGDALGEISSARVAGMFSKTPEEFADLRALDPRAWRELLRWLENTHSLARLESISLTEATRRRVSERLHEAFPRVLYETLKHDFANDGKAYGGLLLQLVGKIAAKQVETLDDVKAIRGDTREILAGLRGVKADTEEILRRLPEQAAAPAVKSALCNLPQRNQFFTGRESYLDELAAELGGNARAVLCGMPGVGKTQTAVEYAYRQHEARACEYVFYVHAASVEELLADFASIARHLNLPVKDEPDFNLIAAAVKAWFEQHDGWLLVFDNADDLTVLFDEADAPAGRHNYVPANRRGRVLLTRRPSDAGGFARTIEIKEMDDDEGALLLLRRAGPLAGKSGGLGGVAREVAEAARSIAREVGGLPLALDIAGAYIKETGTPPAEYFAVYREEGKALRRERDEQDPYRHSVATVFSLTFKRVATPDGDTEDDAVNARAAADLLRLCAFVAPDAIPLEHFTAGASELGDDLGRVMVNKIRWAKTKRRVLRFALLDRNAGEQTFDTHRLVQAVIRDEMDAETQRLWTERALRALSKIFPDPEFSKWKVCDLLLPHALDCLLHARACDFRTEEMAHLVHAVAYHLDNRARYDEAESLYLQALELYQENIGERHTQTATCINNLAMLHSSQGRFEEAEPLLKRALAIREEALGEEHEATAASINNLAALYYSQGRFEEAEPLLKKALEICESVLGENDADTAGSLNNLGILYFAQGRYDEAEPLYRRASKVCVEVLGENHPDTASSINNMALLYFSQGRFEEAEPLYRRATEISREVLGEKHPDTATGVSNLAELYFARGRYDEAEPLLIKSLEVRREILGEKHPNIADSLNKLGTMYYLQGRHEEAEPLYLQALEIWSEVVGDEHPDMGTCNCNLAELYFSQGYYEEAEPLFKRAQEIFGRKVSPTHPIHAYCRRRLSELAKLIAGPKPPRGEGGVGGPEGEETGVEGEIKN